MHRTVALLMATLTPSPSCCAGADREHRPGPAGRHGPGTLADIVDRRLVVMATQALLLASTTVLGVATLGGMIERCRC